MYRIEAKDSDATSIDWSGAAVLLLVVSAALFRFMLTAGLPLSAYAVQVFDDDLFIRLAESVVAGEWLGNYDKLTLVKSPLYPLFIAANYLLGFQFKAMEHLLYILACVVFYFALLKISVNRYLALVPFLLLLFSPYHHGSVERGWFYTALTLLVVAGMFYLTSLRMVSGVIRRRYALLLGLGLAALYLSREETVWLYPLLMVAFVLLFYQADRRGMVIQMGKTLPLILLGAAFPILVVMSLNYFNYGLFGVKDATSSQFISAIKAMKSVRSGEEMPYVDVSRDALREMYKVSPTLLDLDLYLSGNNGKTWGSYMCRRYASACGEIGGGYFFWALRDAVEANGGFQQYAETQRVFSDIHDELSAACNDNRLDCSRSVWPVRYPIRWNRVDSYLAKLPGIFTYMVTGLHGRLPGYGPSRGPQERLDAFMRLSNSFLLPQSSQTFTLSGWLISDDPDKYLAIVPKEQKNYSASFSLKKSPDLPHHFPQNDYAGISRFSTQGQCENGQCELLVMSGSQRIRVDQSKVKPGKGLQIDGMRLHIDSIVKESIDPPLIWKIETFKKIGRVYNAALVYLTAAASVIFLYALFALAYRGYRSLLFGVAVMSLFAIGGRLAVLALFDDFTQIPIVGQFRHFLAVMPFLLMFIGLNILMLFDLIPGLKRKNHTHRAEQEALGSSPERADSVDIEADERSHKEATSTSLPATH
ncbi:MAG: hypothetical protein KZQ76_01810 [Candidatus Thiodiazotropha sp. (ex Epidulcina cf. delphinae)]|nr:hypothetical protein [Candidatus Thiodiazotropha sp. (ex Epidulcina cf. delphinae)]